MTTRYTLHGLWLSGPTYKVALMLSLLGEKFDYVHVDLRAGEHKRPEYLAKNRFGQVPCLVDNANGRQLCQSASILECLADASGKFGGASRDERIRIREWMYWEFDRLAPNIFRSRAIKIGVRKAHEAIVEMHASEGNVALKVLDDQLKGRQWLVGDAPTIADVDVYVVVSYAPEGGYNLADYPNVGAWMKRVEALPGFATADKILPKETKAAA